MEFQLAVGCFKALLEKFMEPVLAKIKDCSINQWNKFKIDFDLAFRIYVEEAYNKYSKIKTILYRTEPKYIYDFFEPPTLLYQHTKSIKAENVDDILTISHFIIIQGIGGIGKSMLMKHLFLNELEHKELIPIYLELKDVNFTPNWQLDEIVQTKLESLGYELDKKYLNYALESGCFLFLLDGYDEIYSEKKSFFWQHLEFLCDKYGNNYYIISSRPYSEFIEFQRFTVLEALRFSKDQTLSLVRKIDFDKEIKDKFLYALDKKLYDSHTSFASNPLLLNIMLLTFDNYAEIPEKLHVFYAYAFDTMCSKHDATKGGFHREWKSKLSFDIFKQIFAEFCIVTYSKAKIEFTYNELEKYISEILKHHKLNNVQSSWYIDDLRNALCIIYKDGTNYRFAHRSFQEYFTAYFLDRLTDEQMKIVGIRLIQNDIDRAIFDNVFAMLYDINKSRFEENILLPLLAQCEQERSSQDKYAYYFSQLYTKIFFRFISEEGHKKGNISGMSIGCNNVGFIDKFMPYYYNKFDRNQEKENALLDYFLNKKNPPKISEYFGMDKIKYKEIRLTVEEIPKDQYAYDLIKETWIGKHIENLSSFYELLSNKQKNDNIDFSRLLD